MDCTYAKQYWIVEETAFQVGWIKSVLGIKECGKITGDNPNLVVTQFYLESGCR
jgi:hypothetical protein